MKYTTNCTLDEFNAWSGGATALDELRQHPEAYAYISDMLDDMTECSEMTETDINDFLWFELDDVLQDAGYYDVDSDEWSEAA